MPFPITLPSPLTHALTVFLTALLLAAPAQAYRIKEVAAKLGYDDPYYFSRLFQKTLGCSPLAYRRSVKG
jgi:AraC-like DNA-binding protein